jgi:hypothetical protein
MQLFLKPFMQILMFVVLSLVIISAVLLACGLLLFNKSICKEYNVEIEEILFSTRTFQKSSPQVCDKNDYQISDGNEACMA